MGISASSWRIAGTPAGSIVDDAAAKQGAVARHLDIALKNAEFLLNYAAQAGIGVEPDVAGPIIAATHAEGSVWQDGPQACSVFEAITKLCGKVYPVTAETLRATESKARNQIRLYSIIAIALAVFTAFLSMVSFITTGLTNSISADITSANAVVVTLHADLESPASNADAASPAALSELAQFAATMRSIKYHAEQLDRFLFMKVQSPAAHIKDGDLELRGDLGLSLKALQSELLAKTESYQQVRLYATDVKDDVALVYGSLTACFLPTLYALLGSCAFLLRVFSTELKARTFSRSYAISARFVCALIGGTIVGLFGNFAQGLSLSPLAIAFLVGYAADVFFTFLEGLLPNFKQPKAA